MGLGLGLGEHSSSAAPWLANLGRWGSSLSHSLPVCKMGMLVSRLHHDEDGMTQEMEMPCTVFTECEQPSPPLSPPDPWDLSRGEGASEEGLSVLWHKFLPLCSLRHGGAGQES